MRLGQSGLSLDDFLEGGNSFGRSILCQGYAPLHVAASDVAVGSFAQLVSVLGCLSELVLTYIHFGELQPWFWGMRGDGDSLLIRCSGFVHLLRGGVEVSQG